MKIVVISGPIASGKSTVGRAVTVELSGRGFDAAIVDLDLVYEILDPRAMLLGLSSRQWRSVFE